MQKNENPLLSYFENNQQRLLHKWMHYFEVYHRHFQSFRDKPITMLEIGVFHGGSLQMWKSYFGEQASIIGVDVNPRCATLAEPQIQIHIGNQADRGFLTDLAQQFGPFDIVLDDGGHTMQQQLVSFDVLYPFIKPNGVYLCEDLHTSYWEKYGGGFKKPDTFIEFSKGLIDALNAYHSENEELRIGTFTRTTQSLHFYDSILVVEKGEHPKPEDRKTGNPSF